MKKCLTCELLKPDSEFYKRKSSKDGLNFHCRKCSRTNRNKWNSQRDKEYWRYTSYKRASLKTGIPIQIIQDAFLSQNGCCKICKSKENEKFLSVDHCHKTNKFRGLLCQKCNTGLGLFNDDQKLLLIAIEYLK